MNIKESLEKLNSDVSFKKYLKDCPTCYLSHFFVMLNNDIRDDWQVGYYNPDSNLMSPYIVTSKEIIAEIPQEPFKKPEDTVLGLDFEDIKIDYDTAISNAKQCLEENYAKTTANKTMVILQKIRDVGNVWNITFITLSLDAINIRINAIDGQIISHDKQSLIQEMS